jgi:predicted component of type VI protein secretion system
VADVRRPGRLRRAALRAVAWAGRLSADLEDAWRSGRLPVLALPAGAATVGRHPVCGCLVTEPSVSRRHAELRRDGERWLLRDLGSRNGTRLNGVPVTGEVEVRPGDQISLGAVRYRLGGPPAA